MALQPTDASCTPVTWARSIRQPEDRREAVREGIESVGRQLPGSWCAVGDRDGATRWAGGA